MDGVGILVPILGIMCGLAAIIANAVLRSQKLKIELAKEERASGASDAEVMREIQRLKERVAVLEKLATDDDRKLAGEIDRLRGDELRR
jgi:hypothetical protein